MRAAIRTQKEGEKEGERALGDLKKMKLVKVEGGDIKYLR